VANRQIPWPRILAEGFAIVVSILLAFGIQAWWEGRADEQRRLALTSGLSADFDVAARRFARQEQMYGRVVESAETLLNYAEAGGVPDEDRTHVDSVFSNLFYSMATFDPPTGTVEAILNSGGLDLFDDERLVSELTGWNSLLEDYKTRETNVTEHFHGTLYPYLVDRLNLQDLDKSIPRELPWPQDPTPAADLLTDQRFHGIIYMHYVLSYNTVAFMPGLRASIDSVAAMVSRELGQ
jgi:hypothetical protein